MPQPSGREKGTLLKVLMIVNNPFLPRMNFESLSYACSRLRASTTTPVPYPTPLQEQLSWSSFKSSQEAPYLPLLLR
jgi:hypothetical protein